MDLKNIKGLSDNEINLLSKYWITTSDEFASIYLKKDLSQNLQQLLHIDKKRYDEVVFLILSTLTPEKINEIKSFKNYQNKSGAKKISK